MLGNGRLLEFDTPLALISDPKSHLSSFVKQLDSAEVEHLQRLANCAVKHSQTSINDTENLSENNHETDPLLHIQV